TWWATSFHGRVGMRHRFSSYALMSVASLLIAGCSGGGEDAAIVRNAVNQHITSEQFVYVTDPRSGNTVQVDLASMQVQDAVDQTAGGRQLVHVTFKAEDGTTYDVDYYVKRDGEAFRIDDVVTHMAGNEDVLPASMRELLNAQQ